MSNDTSKKKPIDPEIVQPEGVHPDEVIHVPKGSSKVRFLMTFLLVIMVLTTFTVSEPIMNALRGDGAFSSYMTWKTPGGVSKTVPQKDFIEQKRALAPVLQMVFPGNNRNDASDEHVAAFIAMDESAVEAGVHVTDTEMAKWIEENFKTTPNYLGYIESYRITRKDFEGSLRRMLRVLRYRDLLAQGMSVADPKVIETAWTGRHQETLYDYVELPVATLMEEARALAPKGDELKAWFDKLSDPEKAAYKLKPEVSAEIVAFSLEGPFAGDAILAKYPRPDGTDADKEAREYHAGFGYVRFPKLPTPEARSTFSQPYDSVKDQAMREAPIYNALMAWVASLKAREAAGENIDLSAEASAIGLSYRKQSDPRNYDGWKELAIPVVGRVTLGTLLSPDMQVGKLLPAIQVDEKGFAFGRVLELRAERLPEFAEIEARVATAWADKKARELTLAKLEKVRDSFGTRPDPNDPAAPPFKPEADEAKFAEVCKAAGLTVQRRDWRDRYAPPPPDETAAELYIRGNTNLTTQSEQTVVKPELNKDGTIAYMVRVGGLRDPDVSNMKVDEFNQAANQQVYQEQLMFVRVKLATREFLSARFDMDLLSWHPEKDKRK